ncbi:hypothetical protein PSHT_14891 [Puccinia striiformis]|uniref:Uncharacterized protein n=1 Tax=Puccinia striiformis TaxID=27350 RepID=A0A2S4UIB1_9BASI|nr:hypothetical protein PSHT_14891 [Puccinia striiformis]
MKRATSGDAHKIYRMIVLHNFASETEDYQEMLRKEANKDVFFNTEAKMIALHDLIEKGFAPPNSIVHPRLWTLRAQGDDVIMNLGTLSVPKSLAKAIIPSFGLSITEWQEAVQGLSIKCGSLYIASSMSPTCLPLINNPATLTSPSSPPHRKLGSSPEINSLTLFVLAISTELISKDPLRSFHDEEIYFGGRSQDLSETEDYQEMLRKEANKDVFFNTEAKMIALHDLIEKGFAPPNSIVHPRLWTLRAQGDDVIMNLGTPSVPKSVAKGQLRSR